MALVNVVSIGVHDFRTTKSGRKTIPLYVDASLSLANINTLLADFLPKLDTVIDPVIQDVSVSLQLTLPGGLKTDAVFGQTVNNGANLSYDAAATDFAYGIYIPGWAEAGFAGDTVINTGDYAALIDDFVTLSITNQYGAALDAFITGLRVRRK